MGATASRSSSKRSKQVGKTPSRQGETRSAKATVTADVPSALAELLALEDQGWVVSCYQKLEPNDRDGSKYRIKLKNRIARAIDRLGVLGFTHDDRELVTDELSRIEEFFSHSGNLDGSRGVAVFAGKGWLRAVKLPHVLRSRVMVDRTPVVSELVALTESGNRILVGIADRVHARLFEVDLEGVRELDSMIEVTAPPSSKWRPDSNAPGVGEYRFHSRIREEKHRHLAHTADAMARAYRQRAFDGVVVGGIGPEADALLPHLPTELRDRVIGVLRLAPKQVTPAEIRERAVELWADAVEAAAADAVGELDGLKASGWAVDGVEPALEALSLGQVRTLIVDADAEVPGYRMPLGGRLSTTPTGLKSEGEPVPVADLLDDAIEDTLRQRARVAVVGGDQAAVINKLAAILRFRINGK